MNSFVLKDTINPDHIIGPISVILGGNLPRFYSRKVQKNAGRQPIAVKFPTDDTIEFMGYHWIAPARIYDNYLPRYGGKGPMYMGFITICDGIWPCVYAHKAVALNTRKKPKKKIIPIDYSSDSSDSDSSDYSDSDSSDSDSDFDAIRKENAMLRDELAKAMAKIVELENR
jgi:hypothetical protein